MENAAVWSNALSKKTLELWTFSTWCAVMDSSCIGTGMLDLEWMKNQEHLDIYNAWGILLSHWEEKQTKTVTAVIQEPHTINL